MMIHFQRDGRRVCAVLQASFCGRRWDMRASFGQQQYDCIMPDRTSKLIPVCTSWLMALHPQAAMPGLERLAVLADGVLG